MEHKKRLTILRLAVFASCLSGCTLWNSSSGSSSVPTTDGGKLFFGGKFTDEPTAATYFKRNGTKLNDGSYKVGYSSSISSISYGIAYQPSDETYCLSRSYVDKRGTGIFTEVHTWSAEVVFKFDQNLKETPINASYTLGYAGNGTAYSQKITFQVIGFKECPSIDRAHYSVVSIESSWQGDIETEDQIATNLYDQLVEALKDGEGIVQKIDTNFTLW
jgi:hypothetical protein